jgi:hypothetical protein
MKCIMLLDVTSCRCMSEFTNVSNERTFLIFRALFLACFGVVFEPGDDSNTFVRNVIKFQTTLRHISQDVTPHNHQQENLKMFAHVSRYTCVSPSFEKSMFSFVVEKVVAQWKGETGRERKQCNKACETLP